MTLSDRSSGPAFEPLTDEEQQLQRALGTDGPPDPRRTQAAFAASVRGQVEARQHRSRRWAFVSAPLAAAAAFGIVLGMPAPTPSAASGADLYALTLEALDDDEGWPADAFADTLDEDNALDATDLLDTVDVEDLDLDDAPLSAAVTTLSDAELLDAFNDEELTALNALLDESLAN